MTQSAIRTGAALTNVSAGYARQVVLHEVSAVFPAGAVTALVGANGSGKSTALSVLAGIVRPAAGSVERPAGRAALVVQHDAVPALLPITVREAVEMGRWAGHPWRRLSRRDRAVAERCLTRLGLDQIAGRRLSALSGGQRQRALVAQALAQETDLLLLDEPTAALDVPARETISRTLREVADSGVTVVHATHDLTEARAADHCVLLRQGRVLAEGPPETVLSQDNLLDAWH
ncbi:zinc ABC transporter ATP-binding protein AztA [Amycolatopsis sp. ATCC 39116]|uniref:zinc ABC transporter ATP-binding protein AztA n=1 Tax=Amycolatopsis sp. (strain ATCC 39116 / 75iv2) TaxID=385957 RepID=UPI0002625DD6|nr:zinc ABC transporter ATP-binding protein AztA [Amycolatopsis sp. ATCC 39116]